MSNQANSKIFLSYSWANTDYANEIDNYFKNLNINFTRDIRDLEYRRSIKDFMHTLSKHDFVIMLISDEYLRSESCMYEVTELISTHTFKDRILPIVLDNARHIFKPIYRETYYIFWKNELKRAEKLKKTHQTIDYIELVRKYSNINNYLDVFFSKLTDLNILSVAELKRQNYEQLRCIIKPNVANNITIGSPLAGIFYRSASPEKLPFVNIGDNVQDGTLLCIIEAMGELDGAEMMLFNEIESEIAGRITEILVKNGSKVEYNQPLFLIEP